MQPNASTDKELQGTLEDAARAASDSMGLVVFQIFAVVLAGGAIKMVLDFLKGGDIFDLIFAGIFLSCIGLCVWGIFMILKRSRQQIP